MRIMIIPGSRIPELKQYFFMKQLKKYHKICVFEIKNFLNRFLFPPPNENYNRKSNSSNFIESILSFYFSTSMKK